MNFIHRNKLYIGIILGAILPWITYFIINFIYDQLRSPSPIDPYREAMLIERKNFNFRKLSWVLLFSK